MMNEPQRMVLPGLRDELALQPAPAGSDGAPRWTLHDPADNRFFEIGWPAFEMLSRWHLREPSVIANAVNAETTLSVTPDDVLAVAHFLIGHSLTQTGTPQDTQRLLAGAARRKLSAPKWLLKNYLFMRFPLVRPMPFLRRFYPWIRGVYSPVFWWLVLGAAVLGLYLVSRQWDTFVHTFRAYAGWQGLLGLGVAISFAKVLHELGHAFTAYRYGCRVPNMGVALLVMWPVLYTDTNEAWKLSSRRQRLHIGAAGMLAELALAAFATLLWSFLPEGPLRAGVFMLATSTWLLTLAVNASPFTRFDGYFLLSDWLNMPNLHERAFALGRWWLRERLFGFGDEPPELLPTRRRRFIIGFALVTWIYRFVLFLSIALLVFHVFFHALGIALMLVEIGWFLALPIGRELTVWWQRRSELRWQAATRRTALMLVVLAIGLCVPWQSEVSAPAVVGLEQAQRIYTPEPAHIDSIEVTAGPKVAAGTVLARLSSPELTHDWRRAKAQVEELTWQVQQQPFDDDLRALGPALQKQLDTARAAEASYGEQIERLTIRAPFAGHVVDISSELHAGAVLARGEELFQFVGAGGIRGDAYVAQHDIARIRLGERVAFIGDLARTASCRVSLIDSVNLAALDEPYVASTFGGGISVVQHGDGSLHPLEPVYRVRFDNCKGDFELHRELAGIAAIKGETQSIVATGARKLFAFVRAEIGLPF